MRPGITVVIPTIKTRRRLLQRALASVEGQAYGGNIEVSIEYDEKREGAGPTRNRALRRVETEWTAFLDDDDLFYPRHLRRLEQLARHRDAKVARSWFDGNTVFADECQRGLCPNCHRHRPFDVTQPHLFGIAYLVRTDLAQQCEFPAPEADSRFSNEDYHFLCQLAELTTNEDWTHTPEKTWVYAVHGANTSGRPENW